MKISTTNQKPAVLYDNPYKVLPLISPDKDGADYMDNLLFYIDKRFVEPLYQPINQSLPVSIQDISDPNQPIDIDRGTLNNAIQSLWSNPTFDIELEEQVNEIYRQATMHTTQNDWFFEEQLVVEALTMNKLPLPVTSKNRTVKYTAASDVIPAAKGFLADQSDDAASHWFANIAAYTRDRSVNDYLMVTVQSDDAFIQLKEHIKNKLDEHNKNGLIIDSKTHKLFNDLDKISVASDLSSCIMLPGGGMKTSEQIDSMSFSRIFMNALAEFERNQPNPGALSVQPTNLKQTVLPESVIIINLENYAHAKPSEISTDWDELEEAYRIRQVLNFVSNKRLVTAQSINRSAQGGSPRMASSGAGYSKTTRIKEVPFTGKPVTAKASLNMMKAVINGQISRRKTENSFKTATTSFMRPNRRQPNNINLPGKSSRTAYRPDIHVYLDTSGSISESQYRDAIVNLLALTQKINTNFYFTSFSDVISETALLKTQGASLKQAYHEFQNVPKVHGGTDFENVWHKIDMLNDVIERSNRSFQINFVITDFGYSLNANRRWNPDQASCKHTYYVPVSVDPGHWDSITRYAEYFAKEMHMAGDKSIRSRMLM